MPGTLALIVAAGESRRMGGEIPKPYRLLGGRPLIHWSVETFGTHPRIGGVVVITNPAHKNYGRLLGGLPIRYTTKGGISRRQSVEYGLRSLAALDNPPEKVLIHDVARPFVSAALIDRVLAGLDHSHAVIPAIPTSDTLREVAGRTMGEAVPRENVHGVQTPQGFHFQEILDAHRQCGDMSVTDDATVAEQAGTTVSVVEGERWNVKLTWPEDWTLAERIANEGPTVTGTGFDVHRLLPRTAGTEKPLMLGGVPIPCEFYLDGHSDADVVLHALTDAILGTIAAGDIGTHFPPGASRWKDAGSAVFIDHALRLLAEQGGRLLHADVTVIAEKPEIAPHRTMIRTRLSERLGLPLAHVSLKATTTEGLGFLGVGDGIAAQAAVSVSLC